MSVPSSVKPTASASKASCMHAALFVRSITISLRNIKNLNIASCCKHDLAKANIVVMFRHLIN